MKATKAKSANDLRMSADEFGRIMGQALKVKPKEVKTPKSAAKQKPDSKKKRSPK